MNLSLATSPAARIAGLLLLAGLCSAESCPSDIGDGDQPSEYTVLVSKSSQGGESSGPGGGSLRPSSDEFGAFVAFDSDAVNLVADGNAKRDVFIRERNRSANSTLLVSYRTTDNAQGGEDSQNPSLSADGSTIAFESFARLAVGPQGVSPDGPLIFVHTWAPPALTRLVVTTSLPLPPIPTDPPSYLRNPSLSGDGRYVAFESNVANLNQVQPPLAPYVWDDIAQVYVADLSANPATITLISRASATPLIGGNNNSRNPKISRDGSVVAFDSDATDLQAGLPGTRHVFVGFTAGGPCVCVSLRDDDNPVTQFSFSPSISYDGNLVAFVTNDAVIAPTQSIALRDRTALTTIVLSQAGINDYVQSPTAPALAGNGSAAVFLGSPVTSLAGLPSGFTQVWAWSPGVGVRMVSTHLTGNLAADECEFPAISGDGLWAFWSTAAANLVSSDLNGQNDIFTRGPLQ